VALFISVDANSKINGLMVKPFVEEVNSESVINNLTIISGIITQNQSELIFKNAKSFPNKTQISIGIIKDGEVSYYGINKVNDTVLTINNHKSIFEIGSISKVFTSTLLANFVVDGKIELNNNINDYLNSPFNNGIKISFIDLANHTSGLPRLPTNLDLTRVNPENPYKEYKEQELKEYLTNHLDLTNKGEYQYSNLGAGLLGYTLSEIENITYEDLLQSKIFHKYNMQNSTAEIDSLKEKLVKGLNNEGNEIPNWEFSALAGAGSILSTTEDLSKFAIAQFDFSNKELKLTRKKTFEVNKNMNIGLGWHLLTSKSKNIWYWHNGGTAGYSSSMVIDEKTKNGVIILSNVSAFNPKMGNIDNLCFELMKTLEKE
jgi:CubicO group peptidase (beta-lactamase class C family)